MFPRASGLPGKRKKGKVAAGSRPGAREGCRSGYIVAKQIMDILPFASGAAAAAVKLHRSVEERAIATYIVEAAALLNTVRLSSSLSERLAGFGFDDEELAIGMELQEEAANAFQVRHDVLPEASAVGLAALTTRMNKARDDFAEYRGVARAAFTDLSARTNLRVTGDTPDDLQRFLNNAYEGYTAAQKEPFTAKLTKRGYPPERLAALLDDLDNLATLDVAHEIAASDAEEEMGMSPCDDAYNALKEYMKEIKGVIRAVYRKQPEVLQSLGLEL
jgi:hypothetical protein